MYFYGLNNFEFARLCNPQIINLVYCQSIYHTNKHPRIIEFNEAGTFPFALCSSTKEILCDVTFSSIQTRMKSYFIHVMRFLGRLRMTYQSIKRTAWKENSIKKFDTNQIEVYWKLHFCIECCWKLVFIANANIRD